jgi:hypothetical protein
VSTFPAQTPRWILHGGFIQRLPRAHGAALRSVATNNTLLKVSAWKNAGSPRFDDSFSTTGGSDTKFFSALYARGVRIQVCAPAVVFEPVLAERMRVKWIVRRGYRLGIVAARVWAPTHGRPRTVLKGVWLAFSGAFRMLADLVLGRGLQAASVNVFLKGLGVLSGLIGIRVHEYKRPARLS